MKALAIVVTFNRLELLKRCIASLKSQTLPLAGILVVNNGSTDGTAEWLSKQEGIMVLNQENMGGAGGFHHGMKEGSRLGFDWLWCMDDDCSVEGSAFEALRPHLENTQNIYGSVAISEKDANTFAWFTKVKLQGNWVETNDYSVFKEMTLETTSIPFLGFCIHRDTLDKIGLPLKDIFIWGDDAEMCLRARQKFNVSLYYIRDSIIFHPQTIYRPISVLGMKMNAVEASPLKRLYEYRNNIFLLKQHSSLVNFYGKVLPKTLLRLLVQNIYVDKDTSPSGWLRQLNAVRQGMQGKLGQIVRH